MTSPSISYFGSVAEGRLRPSSETHGVLTSLACRCSCVWPCVQAARASHLLLGLGGPHLFLTHCARSPGLPTSCDCQTFLTHGSHGPPWQRVRLGASEQGPAGPLPTSRLGPVPFPDTHWPCQGNQSKAAPFRGGNHRLAGFLFSQAVPGLRAWVGGAAGGPLGTFRIVDLGPHPTATPPTQAGAR